VKNARQVEYLQTYMKEDIIFQLPLRRGERGNVVKTSGKELLLNSSSQRFAL
jgi:hypothetical protein